MNAAIIAIAIQIIVSVVIVAVTRAKVSRALGEGDAIEKVRREVGALIVELDGSADRNITVIEDRIKELKELVAEADKRIALLAQEKGRRQAETSVYDRLGRAYTAARTPAEPQREPHREPSRAPAEELAPRPLNPDLPFERPSERVEESPKARPAPDQAPQVPFIRFSDKPVPIEEPFADKARALYRRGFSSDIIAAKLGATIAEVDLAIASAPPEGSS